MRDEALRSNADALPDATRAVLLVALVTLAGVLFSAALACAAPFAALAALAGWTLPRRDAVVLVAGVWLANQAVGYLLLGYPTTGDSFAWGGVIGLATVLASMVASVIGRQALRPAAGLTLALVGAFAVFQAVLFAATAVLPSSTEAFSAGTVAEIFLINLLAFVGLLALHRLALAAGLLVRGGAEGRVAA